MKKIFLFVLLSFTIYLNAVDYINPEPAFFSNGFDQNSIYPKSKMITINRPNIEITFKGPEVYEIMGYLISNRTYDSRSDNELEFSYHNGNHTLSIITPSPGRYAINIYIKRTKSSQYESILNYNLEANYNPNEQKIAFTNDFYSKGFQENMVSVKQNIIYTDSNYDFDIYSRAGQKIRVNLFSTKQLVTVDSMRYLTTSNYNRDKHTTHLFFPHRGRYDVYVYEETNGAKFLFMFKVLANRGISDRDTYLKIGLFLH